jgi:hypothetical protein
MRISLLATPRNAWLLLLVCASSVCAQTAPVPGDTVITLERTTCGGECPAYRVSIDARGNVVYEGTEFVRVKGLQRDQISVAHVTALLETATRIGFFELREQYRFIQNPDATQRIVTDLPTAFVTVTREGQSRRVEDYLGSPDGLKELESQIDGAARTKQWVFVDERTLDRLVLEGWAPARDELADFLRLALENNDVGVIKGVLNLGADPNWNYFETETPPLMMVRSVDATRLLLDAGADPFKRNIYGRTALGWAAHLRSDVAALLLKSGVPIDDPQDEEARTPLWSAACAGNADVVAVLLAAGANPATRNTLGVSARDCAQTKARTDKGERLPPWVRKPLWTPAFDRVVTLLDEALSKRAGPVRK